MIKKTILFCCCLISSLLCGQETMTVYAKSYAATPTWNFICENYAYSGTTLVQIAKTEKGGLFKIVVETNDRSFAIAGTLYVDLIDTSTIVCTDKNIRETNGNQIISYYTLTAAEMNRLKKTEIQSVRYSIKGKNNKFSSQTGYFTAINKKTYFATAHDNSKKSYETDAAIAELYH
ncbi:hypothetical protein [Flavobacterium sp.]|uniref:hypothetical protein n=1 Tax=Flavobacterium sp. TaxID=239 RepID=UPI00286ABCD7|nr:hypothetical protein [Flavobacterium sp.]